MAEWIFECGIGEDRAALIEDGVIVEAAIERPGLRAGSVVAARLTEILVPGRRGVATIADGSEVLIEPVGHATAGAAVRVEIVREGIFEPGALKRPKGLITEAAPCDGPDLAARIGACRVIGVHDPDAFEAAGWSETLEAAARGVVGFAGGTLRISLTPAMTLIDVDGPGDAAELAATGVRAAAKAIRRFGIAGNIGIDLPTVSGKAARQMIGAAFDAALPPPFERTAVNGFGFLQIVRPRVRASLCELLQHDATGAEARALMRRAQRSGTVGATRIDATPAVKAVIKAHPDWTSSLSRTLGGSVALT